MVFRICFQLMVNLSVFTFYCLSHAAAQPEQALNLNVVGSPPSPIMLDGKQAKQISIEYKLFDTYKIADSKDRVATLRFGLQQVDSNSRRFGLHPYSRAKFTPQRRTDEGVPVVAGQRSFTLPLTAATGEYEILLEVVSKTGKSDGWVAPSAPVTIFIQDDSEKPLTLDGDPLTHCRSQQHNQEFQFDIPNGGQSHAPDTVKPVDQICVCEEASNICVPITREKCLDVNVGQREKKWGLPLVLNSSPNEQVCVYSWANVNDPKTNRSGQVRAFWARRITDPCNSLAE